MDNRSYSTCPIQSFNNDYQELSTFQNNCSISSLENIIAIQSKKENSSKIIPPEKCLMPKSLMTFYNCYQRLDMPPCVLGRPQLINSFASNDKISINELWLAHMKLLFRNFQDQWMLHINQNYKTLNPNYFCFRDVAKVRFFCKHCMDGWTSMFGVVIFTYCLDEKSKTGDIYSQIIGQKCKRCNPSFFEMPLWYPEEAQKVITNLYYDIASKIYGFQTPLPIKTRRLGQPVNKHDKDLCEGCNQGLCKQSKFKELNASPIITVMLPTAPNQIPFTENGFDSFQQGVLGPTGQSSLMYSPVAPNFSGLNESFMGNPAYNYFGYCVDYPPVTWVYPCPTY